jgi:hypothetical protein
MGAPNVEHFLPSPDAAIRVSDFRSPRELAEVCSFFFNTFHVN